MKDSEQGHAGFQFELKLPIGCNVLDDLPAPWFAGIGRTAAGEKNWFLYAITPDNGKRKPRKIPVALTPTVNSVRAREALGIPVANAAQHDLLAVLAACETANDPDWLDAFNIQLATRDPKLSPALGFIPGYLPRPGSGMIGGDFDGVLNGGQVAPWLNGVLTASYLERSVSGTGLRALIGRRPGDETLPIAEKGGCGFITCERKGMAITLNPFNQMPILDAEAPRMAIFARWAEADAAKARAKPKPRSPGGRRTTGEGYSLAWLAAIYARLPNELDYDEWVRLGLAFKSIEPELPEAFAVFAEFTSRYTRGTVDPAETEAKWRSFNPTTVSAGTLWHMAKELGWDGRNPDPQADEPPSGGSGGAGNGDGNEAGPDGTTDIYLGRVDAIERSEPVDEVCRRLSASRLAFQYAGEAALVIKTGSAVYRDPHDETKPALILRVVPAVPDALRRPVERVSRWRRHDERKNKLVAKPVPDWVLRQIVAEHGADLPTLLGVADHPVFHDGQLVGGHLGFHPPTNLYIHCDAIPTYPWRDPIDAARFLTENWLGRFPFREPGDLERALFLPLTLLTRRTTIRGGAPFFFITSPESRTGKSLLARCLIRAITGVIPATVPFKTNPEEFNKTFDAAVLEGQATVYFNNAPNGWRVGTTELDTYADSDEYSPRILGSSSKRTVPALAIVVVCGNNIVAASDTTTRVLEVRLERKKDEAGLVSALDFTAADRPKILSALAELLRHPVPPVTAESRFPAWESIVARPLMNLLGASTTLKDIAEAVSGSATNPDYEDFVLRLADLVEASERATLLAEDRERARWLSASELIADMVCNDLLTRLLTRRGVAPTLRANTLPVQLAAFKDQAAAGYRLRIKEMPEKEKPGRIVQNRTFKHFTAEPTG